MNNSLTAVRVHGEKIPTVRSREKTTPIDPGTVDLDAVISDIRARMRNTRILISHVPLLLFLLSYLVYAVQRRVDIPNIASSVPPYSHGSSFIVSDLSSILSETRLDELISPMRTNGSTVPIYPRPTGPLIALLYPHHSSAHLAICIDRISTISSIIQSACKNCTLSQFDCGENIPLSSYITDSPSFHVQDSEGSSGLTGFLTSILNPVDSVYVLHAHSFPPVSLNDSSHSSVKAVQFITFIQPVSRTTMVASLYISSSGYNSTSSVVFDNPKNVSLLSLISAGFLFLFLADQIYLLAAYWRTPSRVSLIISIMFAIAFAAELAVRAWIVHGNFYTTEYLASHIGVLLPTAMALTCLAPLERITLVLLVFRLIPHPSTRMVSFLLIAAFLFFAGACIGSFALGHSGVAGASSILDFVMIQFQMVSSQWPSYDFWENMRHSKPTTFTLWMMFNGVFVYCVLYNFFQAILVSDYSKSAWIGASVVDSVRTRMTDLKGVLQQVQMLQVTSRSESGSNEMHECGVYELVDAIGEGAFRNLDNAGLIIRVDVSGEDSWMNRKRIEKRITRICDQLEQVRDSHGNHKAKTAPVLLGITDDELRVAINDSFREMDEEIQIA